MDRSIAIRVKDICLKHQVIEEDKGGATRISRLFLPIIHSNLKMRSRMLDAIIISVHQFCPEASLLEKAVLSTALTQMVSRKSEKCARIIATEMEEQERRTSVVDGKESLKNRGIIDFGDVMREIQQDYDAK